ALFQPELAGACFHGVEGVDGVILFPKGKVSGVQEMQLTRVGGNVITLEVHGTFDDCQAIAKTALADDDIKARAEVTSANSINVARWLPQQIYYFAILQQMNANELVMSVPSGNFGNLAAGMLAAKSGLPIKRFIAACNANDVVPRFLRTNEYEPRPSIQTLSNAMDVGSPSNFVRILEMFDGDTEAIKRFLSATSISDDETKRTIRDMYKQCNYILDPHGAVAFRALADDLDDDEYGVFLETAHPIKFDSVSKILEIDIPVPNEIEKLADGSRASIEVDNNYEAVKDLILSKI
ncbi:MAG TPA: threonine synthase, partial [Pyrinomonadaceae bacterium]|nr:threonine synthase [Pyrinomonadaceae bacterium]